MIRYRLIALIGLALLLGACTGTPSGQADGDPGATAASGRDSAAGDGDPAGDDGSGDVAGGAADLDADAACSLLTADEVEAALGPEVTGTVGDGGEGAYQCLYDGPDGIGVLSLFYYTESGALIFENFKRSQPEVEEIAGVGDEAIWFDPGQFMVRKGDQVLILQNLLFAQDEATARAAAEQLARIALGRI